MVLVLLGFAALFEYVFVRPFIINQNFMDGTDFIGFVLAHSLLAYVGKLSMYRLDDKQQRAALFNGAIGGLLGYVYMLIYIHFEQREMHHLLAANCLILAGIIFGSWDQRRKRSGTMRTSSGRRL